MSDGNKDHFIIDSFTYVFIHLDILKHDNVWNDIDQMLREFYGGY